MTPYDRLAQRTEAAIMTGLLAGADDVLDEIRATAPVRTGAFRDSFGVAVGAGTVAAGTRSDAFRGRVNLRDLRVASKSRYGVKLALGWSKQAAAGWIDRAARAALSRRRTSG